MVTRNYVLRANRGAAEKGGGGGNGRRYHERKNSCGEQNCRKDLHTANCSGLIVKLRCSFSCLI